MKKRKPLGWVSVLLVVAVGCVTAATLSSDPDEWAAVPAVRATWPTLLPLSESHADAMIQSWISGDEIRVRQIRDAVRDVAAAVLRDRTLTVSPWPQEWRADHAIIATMFRHLLRASGDQDADGVPGETGDTLAWVRDHPAIQSPQVPVRLLYKAARHQFLRDEACFTADAEVIADCLFAGVFTTRRP